MNIFISNVNNYIDHYAIKQSFISLKSGIEKNKLSRILTGKQDILQDDMLKLSETLNKEIIYFMNETLEFITPKYEYSSSIAFYMGTVTEEKEELATQIFDFLEHIDAILGIKNKIEKHGLGAINNGI